jgi:hypothetical protein
MALRLSILRCIFVLTIVTIPLAAIFPSLIPPITVARVQHDGLNYDARFPTSPAFRADEFNESRTSSLQSIQYHVPFRAFETRPYSDLLQSAPLNDGVRVELDRAGTLAIVIGSSGVPGYTPYILKSNVPRGDWHVLDLSITRDDRLRASLDNVVVADTINPDFSFKISAVSVGSGFDRTRAFDGQVRAASFFYVLENRRSQPPALLLQNIQLTCFVLNLIALLLMSDDRNPEQATADEPQPA